MRIAICDDEAIFREELSKDLLRYSKSKLVQIDILEYTNGISLLSSKEPFDIVFLDYQMPGPDGMETARRLRAKNALCCIIFVTNYPAFVLESFEVNPFRFYNKPITTEQVDQTLTAYIKNQKTLAPILVCDHEGQRTIPFREIVYVEGDGKNSRIRTTSDVVNCSKTVATVVDILPKFCFYRTHKSYVINMYYVERIEGRIVYLTNGERAMVGRTHIADFKRQYCEFIKTSFLSI